MRQLAFTSGRASMIHRRQAFRTQTLEQPHLTIQQGKYDAFKEGSPRGLAEKVAFSESAFSGRLKTAQRFIAGISRSSRRGRLIQNRGGSDRMLSLNSSDRGFAIDRA